jgi:SAM-dependent methyltransferase
MAERLTFVDEAMPYASMLAAEHLSRYALVKDLCVDRRVLDIACGEGYGSALMKSWGAREVVGVDISDEAVANAQRAFGGSGIEFLQKDASQCASLRDTLGTFDLIVCFETLEHVQDVDAMLRGFKTLSSEGAGIVISCPNDHAVIADAPNEFHLKVYSFDEFRATVTPILGEPSDWAFGTSLIGFGAFMVDAKMLASPPADIRGLMSQEEVKVAAVLPAQHGHEVDSANAAYYIAAWNCSLSTATVAAPISFQAYESPWNNWVASKAEVERLQEELQKERRLRIAADVANVQLREEVDQAKASASPNDTQLRQTVSAMKRLNDETVVRWRAESAELLQRAEHLDRIERSRWHRIGLKYYALYERPVLGKLLRRARRTVAAIRRI